MFDGVMLKGVEPDYKNKTFKEWYRYYCSEYHWNRGQQVEEMLDPEGDSYPKPSFLLFLYNFYKKTLYNVLHWHRIKWFFQRKFRKNKLSNVEIWDAKSTLSSFIYKVLVAYKKYDRSGYPGIFSEYNENEWGTIEKYNEAIAEGRLIGGGAEAWEKVLDIMLMAFEYLNWEGHHKKQTEWFIKYFGMDPYLDGDERNKEIKYYYKPYNAGPHVGQIMSDQKPNLDECEWVKESISYINFELINYAEHCVQIGIETFAHYFQNLWD